MYKISNSILKRALNIIPEQTMTFAKAAHNYPVNSPKYVKSAKGCWVTDVDGNKFIAWHAIFMNFLINKDLSCKEMIVTPQQFGNKIISKAEEVLNAIKNNKIVKFKDTFKFQLYHDLLPGSGDWWTPATSPQAL